MDLNQKFYQKYQLDWMARNGHSLDELINRIHEWRENAIEYGDAQPEVSIKTVFEDWLEEDAFGGECFACFEEFMTHEYLDISYMFYLLSDKDFERYAHRRGFEVATYTSVWDGGATCITTRCLVDLETREIVWTETFGNNLECGVEVNGQLTNEFITYQGNHYKIMEKDEDTDGFWRE